MSAHELPLLARMRAAVAPSAIFACIATVVSVSAVALSLRANGWGWLPRAQIALFVLSLPPALVAGMTAFIVDAWGGEMISSRPGKISPKGVRIRIFRGMIMVAAVTLAGPLAGIAVFWFVNGEAFPGEFAPLISSRGVHDVINSAIASTYLFLLMAPRLYLPYGPPAVLALGALFACRRPALRDKGKSARDPSSMRETEKSR